MVSPCTKVTCDRLILTNGEDRIFAEAFFATPCGCPNYDASRDFPSNYVLAVAYFCWWLFGAVGHCFQHSFSTPHLPRPSRRSTPSTSRRRARPNRDLIVGRGGPCVRAVAIGMVIAIVILVIILVPPRNPSPSHKGRARAGPTLGAASVVLALPQAGRRCTCKPIRRRPEGPATNPGRQGRGMVDPGGVKGWNRDRNWLCHPRAPLVERIAWAIQAGLEIAAVLSRFSSELEHSTEEHKCSTPSNMPAHNNFTFRRSFFVWMKPEKAAACGVMV